MSVIVFDGVSMAADSYANADNISFPYSKLLEVPAREYMPRTIVGAIGPIAVCNRLLEWVRSGCMPNRFPTSYIVGSGAQLLLASRERGLLRYNNDNVPSRHTFNKLAIGEGAQIAYGALYMNASAQEAVSAAINYSPHCNGVPEVLYL